MAQLSGRGATVNPTSRFASYSVERDPDFVDEDDNERPPTRFWKDNSRSALTRNQSPDIPFDVSVNPYRGCEHGCAYCYARPGHEYLGFSAGLDFERNVIVKSDAPALLRAELMRPSWKPEVVTLSGVTDPYQPIERKTLITRGCLEVLAELGNPVHLITKNSLITRDIDVLQRLRDKSCVRAHISITSLDPELSRIMEPRAAQPARRLETIKRLVEAGIPVTVMAAPMIPGLNEHELPAIVQAAAAAGADHAGYILLRLPGAVQEIFVGWLEQNFPDRKEKILNKIRSLRNGKLNDSEFFTRFRGTGPLQAHLEQLYRIALKKAGLEERPAPLSLDNFCRPKKPRKDGQLELF